MAANVPPSNGFDCSTEHTRENLEMKHDSGLFVHHTIELLDPNFPKVSMHVKIV